LDRQRVKAQSKATAENITKETWTAVTKSFNFFSAKVLDAEVQYVFYINKIP